MDEDDAQLNPLPLFSIFPKVHYRLGLRLDLYYLHHFHAV